MIFDHRPSSTMAALVLLGLALPSAMLSAPAAAQTAPTREEILRRTDRPLAPLSAAPVNSDDEIERAPCPLNDPQFANIRFVLRSVEPGNIGVIDPALLAEAWTGQIGQEIPVSEICAIRDRASSVLQRAGYLAAIRVPEQTISGGIVRLDILAARLTAIQVRGDAGANEHQLQAYMGKLLEQPLFNSHDAERALLLANSMPGLNARLTLRPSGTPGEVIGEVIVQRTPMIVDANFQNFGSNSVGRWGGIARVRFNGLTGLGDQTTLGAYSTADFEEQHVLQGAHEFRIGADGLTVGSSLTYAWTNPTLPGNIDLGSQTLVWSTYARYPLVLRRARSLFAGGGFDFIDQNSDVGGVGLSRDRLRIGWARLDASWIDPDAFSGRNQFTPSEPAWAANVALEVRQGIQGLGASPRCNITPAACFGGTAVPTTRTEGNPGATVFRATGEFAWRPAYGVAFVVEPRAQYATDALLAYEEFAPGNFTVARGYDPGTVTGDSGVGSSFEFRLASIEPRTAKEIAIQPFAFFDAAWVWNEDSSFAGLNPERLFSAGGGVRLAYRGVARLDLTVAQPLRQTFFETRRSPLRFLVSLTTQFGIRP